MRSRIDYSLKRIVHYTGTDWRHMQPWILLTNYHRYVDQFVAWGIEQMRNGRPLRMRCICPGGAIIGARMDVASIIRKNRRAARPGTASRCRPIISAARRRRRRHAGQYRRRPVEREEHHRSSGRAAPALLADDRPLRRLAAIAAHRRLCAGARLSAPGPHSRRRGAARYSDSGAGRSAGGAAGSRSEGDRRARRSAESAAAHRHRRHQ